CRGRTEGPQGAADRSRRKRTWLRARLVRGVPADGQPGGSRCERVWHRSIEAPGRNTPLRLASLDTSPQRGEEPRFCNAVPSSHRDLRPYDEGEDWRFLTPFEER